jgi:hypothetical protein
MADIFLGRTTEQHVGYVCCERKLFVVMLFHMCSAISMYACIVCTCVCMYVCIHICIYVRMYVRTSKYEILSM